MRKSATFVILFVFIFVLVCPSIAEAYSAIPFKVNASIFVKGNIIRPERDLVAVNGRILSPARTTFRNLGARIDWYPQRNHVSIVRGSTVIHMNIGSRAVMVNHVQKMMDAPPILIRGTVMVPVRFVAECLGEEVKWDGKSRAVYIGGYVRNNSQGVNNTTRSWDRTPVVVIDPGHGGRLPGAIYGGVMEKDLNLDIARRLNALLKEEGIKTYMTRYNDSHVSLYSRAALANRVNADLFVSIHNNAGSSWYSGSMTLYYPARGRFAGRHFAAIVQEELVKTLGLRNLGIYPRPRLAVLRRTRMPAVIAEIAYMTNRYDLEKLRTPSFRQDAAEALKNAVIRALKAK